MEETFNRDRLHKKLIISQDITFDNAEEYFFILGQFLIYSFSCLGGIHQYNKEFNYLTNPYLPKDIQQLGIRIIRFITKLSTQSALFNQAMHSISQALVKNCDFYCHSIINIPSCTNAFFEGLHSQNIFEEIIKK